MLQESLQPSYAGQTDLRLTRADLRRRRSIERIEVLFEWLLYALFSEPGKRQAQVSVQLIRRPARRRDDPRHRSSVEVDPEPGSAPSLGVRIWLDHRRRSARAR